MEIHFIQQTTTLLSYISQTTLLLHTLVIEMICHEHEYLTLSLNPSTSVTLDLMFVFVAVWIMQNTHDLNNLNISEGCGVLFLVVEHVMKRCVQAKII